MRARHGTRLRILPAHVVPGDSVDLVFGKRVAILIRKTEPRKSALREAIVTMVGFGASGGA